MTELQFILVFGLAGIALLGLIAAVVIQGRRRKQSSTRQQNQTVASQTAVPDSPAAAEHKPAPHIKAAPQARTPAEQAKVESSNDLSSSGALTIQVEIDRCVAAERWDEAVSWAVHAVEALPDKDEFKVTLAEVYAKAGDIDKFTPLLELLQPKLQHDKQQHDRLLLIAMKVVPDHPLIEVMKDKATH